MTFKEWADQQPRGALKRIERELGVGYSTLMKLCAGGSVARYETAKRISDATDGAVSVEELCNPAPADSTGTNG